MSSTAVQAVPNQVPLYQNAPSNFTLANLANDADVLTIFPEYLGLPFDEFAKSSFISPLHPWALRMYGLAANARALHKPVMLQLVLTRDIIVARADVVGGALAIRPDWVSGCVDFTNPTYSSLLTAYVNYASWMTKAFAPKYVVNMVEANLYYVHCGGDSASWRLLIDAERKAHDAIKAVNVATVAFPSFKVEDLYNQTLNGFDEVQYAALANFKRDRLGLATYPSAIRVPGGFVQPGGLPVDYLSRIRDRHPTEPKIVITETGWNSGSIAVLYQGACFKDYMYADSFQQSAYMNRLLYSAYVGNFDMIVWWSDRDLILGSVMPTCYPSSAPPYTECNGDPWCMSVNNWRNSSIGWTPAFAELAFKSFGTLGLRQYDGTPNPATMALWNRFLVLPVVQH